MRPRIGITLGDPAGIGPEIVLKALAQPRVREKIDPLLFGDRAVLDQAMTQTGLHLPLHVIGTAGEGPGAAQDGRARGEQRAVPSPEPDQPVPLVEAGQILQPVAMGQVDGRCGAAAFGYIRTAIAWALAGEVQALVTAPINKASLQQGGVPYIDHSEMLAGLTASPKPMTLFVVDTLRIFFLTKHIPLRRVADALTIPAVVEGLVESDRGLRQLGLRRRRIAVAALNPHASDAGLFGDEEARILAPAVAEACRLGLDICGPVPADSVFHLCRQGEYAAVLSLYHDQGHIAAKTLDFHGTVSFTLGLPFLRTTPDHGTAFAIAGMNQARPESLIAALLAAADYCNH
ncbi:MAG TPA: 4-hydroxythreonine-4-phosphate dehydrogenase PdxA [bacterium]|nr:4-hydroxythreonine-4-phosphate dehydrogenase PdxA [bacterium]